MAQVFTEELMAGKAAFRCSHDDAQLGERSAVSPTNRRLAED
jgi:hypothetical protein